MLPDWPVIATDETGQPHGPFSAKVRDELMRMGIMWQDAAGEFHIKAADQDIVGLNPHIAVCDICASSDAPVVWDCDVEEYEHNRVATGPYTRWKNAGAFYLCEPCGQLVLERDRAGLLRRTVRMFMRRWAVKVPLLEMRMIMLPILENEARALHEMFWAHLKGIKRIEP
jgi:hypothetical protein